MAKIKNPLTIVSSGSVPPSLFRAVVSKSITAVTADDLGSITTIGTYAFYGCGSLTSAEIPATVTSIERAAFQEDSRLESVTFSPNSALTSLANYVFYYCRRLKELILPSGITSIGNNVFNTCDSMTKLVILAQSVPALNNSNAFSNSTFKIYVPTPGDYRAETNWAAVKDGNNESRIFPLVATLADLALVDTTTYTKACVIGADESYKEYTYDGSAWGEVVSA